MTSRQDFDGPPALPPLLDRAHAWLDARAWSLSMLALFLLALGLLSSCVSPQTQAELDAARAALGEAQAAVERAQEDPEVTDEEWRAAVLALAQAQERFVRASAEWAESARDGFGPLDPGALEGGALGIGATLLAYLMRQRTRGKLEARVEEVATRVTYAAQAADQARNLANEVRATKV